MASYRAELSGSDATGAREAAEVKKHFEDSRHSVRNGEGEEKALLGALAVEEGSFPCALADGQRVRDKQNSLRHAVSENEAIEPRAKEAVGAANERAKAVSSEAQEIMMSHQEPTAISYEMCELSRYRLIPTRYLVARRRRNSSKCSRLIERVSPACVTSVAR